VKKKDTVGVNVLHIATVATMFLKGGEKSHWKETEYQAVPGAGLC
jgi:hypothetical protein